MSTHRSNDRSSLCSFGDNRERPWRPVALAFRGGLLFAVVVAGLQTRLSDGRDRPVSSRAHPRDPLFAGCAPTLHLAQHEYINVYGSSSWRETIRNSHGQSADHISPDPPSPLQTAPESA